MKQNQLGENITRYRKEKGLSQEKLAEYMSVSRQAVTKWESNMSKPSSENLIKLAQLLEVSVDGLLGNIETNNMRDTTNVATSKATWLLICFSIACMIAYIITSSLLGRFTFGTLICMFVITVPIQLFLHIYFSNAINHDSFTGIAGYDERIEYNDVEVKKMLAQIDLQIGMLSSVYVFLSCTINCSELNISWINGLLIAVYVLNFIMTILINNYKSVNKIYCNETDKKRAIKGMPIIIVYILLMLLGLGLTLFLFECKGIENNTVPAMKLGGFLLLAILIATIGFFVENSSINKWNPEKERYKINKISVTCWIVCLLIYGIMGQVDLKI